MKKGVRFLALLAAAVLLISAFAGCTVKKPAATVENPVTGTGAPSTGSTAAPVVVKTYQDIILLPKPRSMKTGSGEFKLDKACVVVSDGADADKAAKTLQSIIKTYLGLSLSVGNSGKGITFAKDTSVKAQGYKLDIANDGVKVAYSDAAGAYYAVMTLKQLLYQKGTALPALAIEDAPDFPNRGLMLDISRDKIPKLETLYRIIDLMSDMKMNQLQLYIEGFSFAYKSYPELWVMDTPLTPADMKKLDAYCKDRFIDFVPNQNSYGHMGTWLNLEKFKKYAECPDGYKTPSGQQGYPSTICPLNSESQKFLDTLFSDLLPNFTSSYFNIGGDETEDVALGKCKDLAKEIGAGQVYLNGLLKIYELAKKYNKTIMFWGDMILKTPEMAKQLPKDIIAMNWGYEFDYNFVQTTAQFKDAGVKFYVCPGTSTWNSIVGRTENMLQNLDSAASAGLENGADGYLLTEWGDNGTWQHLPFSYAPYAVGASLSWCYDQNKGGDVAPYLNRFVFRDDSNKVAQMIMDFGNYYKNFNSRMWNNTWLCAMMTTKTSDNSLLGSFTADECEAVKNQAQKFIDDVSKIKLGCDDADLVTSELVNGATLVRCGAEFCYMRKSVSEGKSEASFKDKAATLKTEYTGAIEEYRRIWKSRNSYSGLDDSLDRLYNVLGYFSRIAG